MAHSPQQVADFADRLDHFAELLSLDIPTVEIRERMGIRRGTSARYMRTLRAKYGWQAK